MTRPRATFPILPRLMKAPMAAWYLSMSETKFAELVKAGRIAQPSDADGMVRWRLEDLDAYVESLHRRDEPAKTPTALRAV